MNGSVGVCWGFRIITVWLEDRRAKVSWDTLKDGLSQRILREGFFLCPVRCAGKKSKKQQHGFYPHMTDSRITVQCQVKGSFIIIKAQNALQRQMRLIQVLPHIKFECIWIGKMRRALYIRDWNRLEVKRWLCISAKSLSCQSRSLSSSAKESRCE